MHTEICNFGFYGVTMMLFWNQSISYLLRSQILRLTLRKHVCARWKFVSLQNTWKFCRWIDSNFCWKTRFL